MKADDLEKMKELFPLWKQRLGQEPGSICVHSATKEGEEVRFIRDLFPFSDVVLLDEQQWNLMGAAPREFDLFITNNTFMYSRDPQRWFDNVLASCKNVWMQDICRGRRDPEKELGNDGDSMRYRLEGIMEARLPNAYDLDKTGGQIVELKHWSSSGAGLDDSLHFYLFLRSKNGVGSQDGNASTARDSQGDSAASSSVPAKKGNRGRPPKPE